jgi:hypothetical protein
VEKIYYPNNDLESMEKKLQRATKWLETGGGILKVFFWYARTTG